jgi:transglutaminase/protease-like cytokinesis protein 3
MKLFLFFSFFFFTFFSGPAQDNVLENDNVYVNIPVAQTNTSEDIAAYINKHFDSDNEKVLAIYKWITTNIKYDADSIHYVILDEDNEQRVTFALRRKKGVCENFAAIFNDLCSKCGISSFWIEGYTKQSGSIDRTPHVWCAAFVDNEWNFYDPTWDAGYLKNRNFVNEVRNNYFKIKPVNFIQTHLPFDPLFQFLNYPVTYKEFVNGNFYQQDPKRFFNYKDSVDSYEKMDWLTRYLSTISRIKTTGWPASKIDTKLKRVKLEIELINQDSDVDLYNSAVADYNRAIQFLNSFLTYRNNQFQPVKSNEEVESIFRNVQKLFASATVKLTKVNDSKATLVLNTGGIQKKLEDLLSDLKEQQEFFKNYVSMQKETGSKSR